MPLSLKGPEDHHIYLHWPRLIFFNLSGALSIASTGLSAAALEQLKEQKREAARLIPGGDLHATNIVAATAAAAAIAAIGALYSTFLAIVCLFRWQRIETRKTVAIKEGIYIIVLIGLLGACIAVTVITMTKGAVVTSSRLPASTVATLVAVSGKKTAYKHYLPFPTMIVLWITFGSLLVTTILVSLAARHISKFGSEPTIANFEEKHARVDSDAGSATNVHTNTSV